MFSEQRIPLIPEFSLILGDHIIDMQLAMRSTKAPHWAFAWAGGIALARFTLDTVKNTPLENHTVSDSPLTVSTPLDFVPSEENLNSLPLRVSPLASTVSFTDKTVLDIGCGSGINTVAALMAGAKTVWASDWEPRARELTLWNVERYFGYTDYDRPSEIEIGSPMIIKKPEDNITVTVSGGELPNFSNVDIVLMGDVFYESADLSAVADAALEAGCTVLIGDAKRDYIPIRQCEELAAYVVPGQSLLEATDKVGAFVYRWRADTLST